VRIDDSAEDREPKYYVRQLMADFLPEHVREAWQLPTGDLPFGFEFITRVTFRDVNFGELAKPGESFKVADKESVRPGFRLCRHCGKVQKQHRRRGGEDEPNHSFECPKRDSDAPEDLVDCLYLYREFESEALRILVPYTKNGVDDRVIQSFMAAVQLGLKKRFGGKVDHLRMVLQDEPGREGGTRRYYVMLYDSVPGGTGYLHQLLAQDAHTLKETLGLAYEAVSKCSCHADPEKDGCYRCIYQYRLGRNMALVSRDTAKAVLGELVAALPKLTPIRTISEIYINPAFDSVLEANFIEALKRLSGVNFLPVVKLVQDVVNGKSGYVLEVGKQRYKIEPQCSMDAGDGLAVASKPDFVIWPWASTSSRRPITVFCDGWAYHKDTLREDALKRSALVSTGRYWVWSVTHNDVAAALKEELETDLPSPLATMARHQGLNAPASIPRAEPKAFAYHALTRLLMVLATDINTGNISFGVQQMQRNALWLGFLMVPHNEQERAQCAAELDLWMHRLPESAKAPPGSFAPSVSKADNLCRMFGQWPLTVARNGMDGADWTAPGVLVLDDPAAGDEEGFHRAWRQWLHLSNTCQTLPGMWMATSSGLDKHDYDVLVGTRSTAPVAAPSHQPALHGAWLEILKQALPALQNGLRQLASAGADMPTIGLELADENGKVVADAELCWSDARLAILRDDQVDLADAWQKHGWRTLVLSTSEDQIDGAPWFVAAAHSLELQVASDTAEGTRI
jgi:DEAD/DEAH box helicase domain-containing protein